jgi:predicted porin
MSLKKLIISVILCLAGSGARAEFSPYAFLLIGAEHGRSFNHQGTVLGTDGKLQSSLLIEDFGSFIGVRGSETIDENIKMIWQVEQYITADHSGLANDAAGNPTKNTLANKDSYMGLLGNFGSVRMGRLSTIPKNDMEVVDPWDYDGKGVTGLAMFTRLDGRMSNAVRYESPGYFGTKLAVIYSPDEAKDAQGRAKDTLNAALIYKDATYYVGYSYYKKTNTNGSDDDTWHRAEVSYDHQSWALALGYQDVIGQTTPGASPTNTGMYNAAVYKAQTGLDPAGKIRGQEYSATLNYIFQEKMIYRLSYAVGSDLKINDVTMNDTGYTQGVLGVIYRASDKAKMSMNYGVVDWKASYNGTTDKIKEDDVSFVMTLEI